MEDLLVTGLVYLEFHLLEATRAQIPAPGREVFVPDLPVRLGGALNVASVLRAMGEPVRLATPIGDGYCGRLLRSVASSLELPLLEWPATRDGSVSMVVHEGGDRAFVSTADFAALERVSELPAAAWVHVPGLREAHALRPALSRAHARGSKISLNLSWYPEGLGALLEDPTLPFDIVVMNELEATEIAGSPEEALRRLSGRATAVVVTLGSGGALARFGERRLQVDASPVRIVDPTGAGDAFCAGLLAATNRGLPPETRMRWGTAAAARVLEIYGGVLEERFAPKDEAQS
jgi:sugar/nucleoside kinase (ribokinase family)